jgi:hypothetical protein
MISNVDKVNQDDEYIVPMDKSAGSKPKASTLGQALELHQIKLAVGLSVLSTL